MNVNTYSCAETIDMGKQFSKFLEDKDVVLLEGDLGGGKTTFIKGVLSGLGSRQRVLSPSFTLVRHYKAGGRRVYHLDLYRIDNARDSFSLGIEDYLYTRGSITLIEWGEKIERWLPAYVKIKFSFLGQERRRIVFSLKGYGQSKQKLFKEVLSGEPVRY